jgi:septin family protein
LPGLCSWEAIEEYIQERFEEFEQAETTIKRHDVRDSRIHCCLYFIAPCVHG